MNKPYPTAATGDNLEVGTLPGGSMPAMQIPDEVLALIRTRVRSVYQLRILRLLRSLPHKEWTLRAVCADLNLPNPLAEEALAQLTAHGLVTAAAGAPRTYRFGPETAELAAMVDRLVQFDRE